MREPYFTRLEKLLAERGIAARYIDRLVGELEDHCADAAAEHHDATDELRTPEWIAGRLGSAATIAAQVAARPELRGRLDGLRAALRPLREHYAELAMANRSAAVAGAVLARWSASIACAAMITAALLLAMAQSIALNA